MLTNVIKTLVKYVMLTNVLRAFVKE